MTLGASEAVTTFHEARFTDRIGTFGYISPHRGVSGWYYRLAAFVAKEVGRVPMTIGEANRRFVLELMHWLGPGAKLREPVTWRAAL